MLPSTGSLSRDEMTIEEIRNSVSHLLLGEPETAAPAASATDLMPEDCETQSVMQSFWSRIIEQRREERLDFRTTGYAYALADMGTQPIAHPIRIWTVDVSTMGALVRSYQPLSAQRLLIDLFMLQLSNAVIEARVVRVSEEMSRYLNGRDRMSYLYGLQFSRLISRDTITWNDLNVTDDPTPPMPNKSPESHQLRKRRWSRIVVDFKEDHESHLELYAAWAMDVGLIAFLLLR